jgi:hypothetical protein
MSLRVSSGAVLALLINIRLGFTGTNTLAYFGFFTRAKNVLYDWLKAAHCGCKQSCTEMDFDFSVSSFPIIPGANVIKHFLP